MTKKYHVNKKISTPDNPVQNQIELNGLADFETAISATGFGKFNFFLLLVAVPACWASIFETSSMSYVFAAAQCDLDLSLDDKGLFNAITFVGMISSSLIWGFLYDALGRKKLLMIGFGLDAVFVLMTSMSQTKTLILITKFLGGFVINGPFSAILSYMSEFHGAKYRAKVQMTLGAIFNFGNIVMPLIAWFILPLNINFSIFDEFITIHSWNIYLIIMSIPSILSTILFSFMPESPKFLMTVGQNEKALVVFQKVYAINSGQPASTYPIKELVNEIELKKNNSNNTSAQITVNRSKLRALKEGSREIKYLCLPPHVTNVIILCIMNTFISMSFNTIRLWLPQILQAMNDYQYYNNQSSADLCTMLEMFQPSNVSETECKVNLNNSSVYTNAMIVASASMFSNLFVGFLVNLLGKKKLINIMGAISGSCAIASYFAPNSAAAVALIAVCLAFGSVTLNIMMAVTIDLFPTTLRTLTLSVGMMVGRVGAMSGNLLFPILLRSGCGPPFFSFGSFIIGCAFLSLLLPNTDLKALE